MAKTRSETIYYTSKQFMNKQFILLQNTSNMFDYKWN